MTKEAAEATQHQVALLAGLAKDLPLEELHQHLLAQEHVPALFLRLVDAARSFKVSAVQCLTDDLEEKANGSLEAAVSAFTNGQVNRG